MEEENKPEEQPNELLNNNEDSSATTTSTDPPSEGQLDKKVYGQEGEEKPKEAPAETPKEAEEQEAAEEAGETIDIELPEGMDPEDEQVVAFMELANEHLSVDEPDIPGFLSAVFGFYDEHRRAEETAGEQAFVDLNEEWRGQMVERLGGETKAEEALGEVAKQKKAYIEAMQNKQGADDVNWKEELDNAFTLTGAGNHPAIVGFISFLASQLGEGRALPGNLPPDTEPKGLAKAYTNMRGGGRMGPRTATN